MSKYRYDHRFRQHHLKLFSLVVILILVVALGLVLGNSKIHLEIFSKNAARVNRAIKDATSTIPTKAPIQEIELLDGINKVRARNKLAPLKMNEQLNQSAANKCKDMADNNYWSHIDAKGKLPWNYISETGYQQITNGENLAYGFNNSSSVVQAWVNSPEHKAVLLNKTYRDTGFAICASNDYISSGPQTIVVQHLALGHN